MSTRNCISVTIFGFALLLLLFPLPGAAQTPYGKPFEELRNLIADLESRIGSSSDREPGTFTLTCSSTETINQSIKPLKPGDTLLVSGTCNENVFIDWQVHNITLDGQGSATINASDVTKATVHVKGRGVTIKEFTITGGEGGVVVDGGGSATILNNRIENNSGDGVLVSHSSSSSIVGNIIRANLNGVLVNNVSQADIASNTIDENRQDGIFVNRNSGVNLGIETEPGVFESPNSTTPNANNAGVGLRCRINSSVDGRLGTLNGSLGPKSSSVLADGGCVDSLSP